MRRVSVLISLMVLPLLILSGCGYSTRSVLPDRFKKVYITPIDNKIAYSSDQTHNSYVPLLEIKVKNAIVDRYLFDGNLRIVPEDQADLILKGELVGFDRNVLRYTDNNDVQEYRIHVTVNLVMWDVKEEKPMWVESGFTGEATYFLTGAQAKSEGAAVDDAVLDLARRIVERTVEDW